MFSFNPESYEIYYRLILRATLAKSLDEFVLKLSNLWINVYIRNHLNYFAQNELNVWQFLVTV